MGFVCVGVPPAQSPKGWWERAEMFEGSYPLRQVPQRLRLQLASIHISGQQVCGVDRVRMT
jgi:hypothetical protein